LSNIDFVFGIDNIRTI